jgi:hypothetical protein
MGTHARPCHPLVRRIAFFFRPDMPAAWPLGLFAGRVHPERGLGLRFPRFVRARDDKAVSVPAA